MRPGADNLGALAWLEHARDRGQRKLENLLETVQANVVFEIRFTGGVLDSRHLTGQEIDER